VGEAASLGSESAPRRIGPTEYWTNVTRLDSRRYSVVATGRDGRSTRRQEVILGSAPNGFFQYAAFGGRRTGLDSNAFIDSYDSLLGDYRSQIVEGAGHALQNAVVGSNGDIALGSNTRIHGDCKPGPGGRVDDLGQRTLVTGSREPADELVELPPIEIPVLPSAGDRTISSDVTLGPGEVRFDAVNVDSGATVTVVGPATLVFESYHMRSGTTIEFVPENGPIEVFAKTDFVLESNTTVVTHSDSALDVKLMLAGDTSAGQSRDRVELSSNADFIGAVYAPNATIALNSNFEIFGSVMAGELDLSSNGIIHFDEALLYESRARTRTLERLAWRRRSVTATP
jgi:hypothetical protein